MIAVIFYLAIVVLLIAGYWKMFEKAGVAGWWSLIPIANIYQMIKIAKRPGWWLVLFLVPIVNIVISIMLCLDLAKVFGKGTGFGVLLILLPYVGIPMLGFGDAKYQG